MTILATHKYGIEYIEHCAVRAADTQLVYVRRKDAIEQHFNIPNLNTAVLLLGPGTSITQQAARLCAEGNILLGFCAGGASPVYMGSMNEYREPAYSRAWIALFNDEAKRLEAAKQFQRARALKIVETWKKLELVKADPSYATRSYALNIEHCQSTQDLLGQEAHMAKQLYAMLASNFKVQFKRKPQSEDLTNAYLDQGNYLAYGLGACVLWVLGIPFSYPLMHGKTRRGALVFDVADLIKDACIMPNAFISAAVGESESQARHRMLACLHDEKALEFLFREIQSLCAAAPAAPATGERAPSSANF